MSRRDSSWLRWCYCRAILLIAAVAVFLFLGAQIPLLYLPVQFDYSEGHLVWMAEQVLDPSKAYHSIQTPPYVATAYPPVYMLATRLANLFSGNLLLAGRSVSLISTVGIGLVVALTILLAAPRRARLSWRLGAAAFGAVLPFLMSNVFAWASVMRVDMLAIFFMYAGLCICISRGINGWWPYAAVLLFVLALFTKHNSLSAPLACLVVGWLAGRGKTARAFALASVLAIAGVCCLNAVTHGEFLRNMLQYSGNPYSWRAACLMLYDYAHANFPLMLIALAALCALWNPGAMRRLGWRRFLRSRFARPYDRAVLLSGLNCAFAAGYLPAIGTAGSNSNYFLVFDVSLCLLSGLFLLRLLAAWTPNRKRCGAAALLCTLLPLCLLLPSRELLFPRERIKAARETERAEAPVVDLIRQTQGPVLSENLLFLVQAGKPLEVEPFTVTVLANRGRWDEKPYVKLFEQQYFRLIVMYPQAAAERYSPAVKSAIQRAYVQEKPMAGYIIYRPREPILQEAAGGRSSL
jgi:hypothetical protein